MPWAGRFASSSRPGRGATATQAPALPDGQQGRAALAGKAYDSNALRARIAAMNAKAGIPSNRPRTIAIPHDADVRRLRNHIERCFNRMKHFRRFATRLTTAEPPTAKASPTSPPWHGYPEQRSALGPVEIQDSAVRRGLIQAP